MADDCHHPRLQDYYHYYYYYYYYYDPRLQETSTTLPAGQSIET